MTVRLSRFPDHDRDFDEAGGDQAIARGLRRRVCRSVATNTARGVSLAKHGAIVSVTEPPSTMT